MRLRKEKKKRESIDAFRAANVTYTLVSDYFRYAHIHT